MGAFIVAAMMNGVNSCQSGHNGREYGQLPGMTCGVAEHEWPVPANGSPNL